MKKFMTFVMIATIGMFCSLGCTKEAPTPTPDPVEVDTPDTPPVDTPAVDTPPADVPAEPAVE